jgi:hypothetical protein
MKTYEIERGDLKRKIQASNMGTAAKRFIDGFDGKLGDVHTVGKNRMDLTLGEKVFISIVRIK